MKKWRAALAVLLILCCVSVNVSAADSDFTITKGVLRKYNGPGGDVVIPNGVTMVGDKAFYDCRNLTRVTIPEGVTSIGYYTFGGCSELTSVTMPDSVTNIGEGAFSGCYKLTSIKFSNSVTKLGQLAFAYCKSITSLTLPDSVTDCYSATFLGCSKLERVTLGSKLTDISAFMFEDCTSLTSVTIPESVTVIWRDAFQSCTNLTDIYYTGSEEQWKKILINSNNTDLFLADIHYNSSGSPAKPDEPEKPTEPDTPDAPTDAVVKFGSMSMIQMGGVKIMVSVECPANLTASVYCASYDANGKLTDLKIEPLKAGTQTLTIQSASAPASMKLMALDSSLIPRCAPVKVPLR